MNNTDLKQIEKLVTKALAPVNKKLDNHGAILKSLSSTVNNHTRILNNHTRILNNHTRTLHTHTRSLVTIENTIKGYGDMYKVNKEKNEKLDQRLEKVEDHLGIIPQ